MGAHHEDHGAALAARIHDSVDDGVQPRVIELGRGAGWVQDLGQSEVVGSLTQRANDQARTVEARERHRKTIENYEFTNINW